MQWLSFSNLAHLPTCHLPECLPACLPALPPPPSQVGLVALGIKAPYVGNLRSVHVRHDEPRLFPGWGILEMEVFIQAGGEVAGAAGGGVPAPPLYQHHFCQPPQQGQPGAWPSPDLPFIRHFMTKAGLGEPVSKCVGQGGRQGGQAGRGGRGGRAGQRVG